MALSKASAGGATTKAIYINSADAGQGASVYTVPEGKVLKAIFHASNSNGSINININSSTASFQMGQYTEKPDIHLTLPPNTTIVNSSTQYFIVSGELVDGS